MSTIYEKANEIKSEKDLKIIPGNIKKDVTILGVTGTLEAPNIKIYSTKAAMETDAPALGTYGVIYEEEAPGYIECEEYLDAIWLPEKVVLSEPITDTKSRDLMYESGIYVEVYPNGNYVNVSWRLSYPGTTYTVKYNKQSDGVTYIADSSSQQYINKRIDLNGTYRFSGINHGPIDDIGHKFVRSCNGAFNGMYVYNESRDVYRISAISGVELDTENKTITAKNTLIEAPNVSVNIYPIIERNTAELGTSGSTSSNYFLVKKVDTEEYYLYKGGVLVNYDTQELCFIGNAVYRWKLDFNNRRLGTKETLEKTYLYNNNYYAAVAGNMNTYMLLGAITFSFTSSTTAAYLYKWEYVDNSYVPFSIVVNDQLIPSGYTAKKIITGYQPYLGWHPCMNNLSAISDSQVWLNETALGRYGVLEGAPGIIDNVNLLDLLEKKASNIKKVYTKGSLQGKFYVSQQTATTAQEIENMVVPFVPIQTSAADLTNYQIYINCIPNTNKIAVYLLNQSNKNWCEIWDTDTNQVILTYPQINCSNGDLEVVWADEYFYVLHCDTWGETAKTLVILKYSYTSTTPVGTSTVDKTDVEFSYSRYIDYFPTTFCNNQLYILDKTNVKSGGDYKVYDETGTLIATIPVDANDGNLQYTMPSTYAQIYVDNSYIYLLSTPSNKQMTYVYDRANGTIKTSGFNVTPSAVQVHTITVNGYFSREGTSEIFKCDNGDFSRTYLSTYGSGSVRELNINGTQYLRLGTRVYTLSGQLFTNVTETRGNSTILYSESQKGIFLRKFNGGVQLSTSVDNGLSFVPTGNLVSSYNEYIILGTD